MKNEEQARLLLAYRAGDDNAATQLYQGMQGFLKILQFGFANVDKDEVRSRFNRGFEEALEKTQNPELFGAVVLNRARGRILSYLSSQRKHEEFIEAADTKTPEEYAIRHEQYDALQEAIQELPQRSRAVVEGTLEGLTQQEIADRLGMPLGTVKTKQFRAKQQLEARLNPPYL